VLAVLLVGCRSPERVAGPVIDRDTGLGRLSTAITTFDAARADVLRSTGALVAAAIALDDADDACAAGAFTAAKTARAKARAAMPAARTALSLLPARLATYTRALAALGAAAKAATSLTDEQRAALGAVVAGGQAEKDASDAFRVAGRSAWPAYEKLDASQSTWLDRRLAGWYRDATEAAAAYAVQVRADRPALERARTLLQRVDAARRPVSERERVAVQTADAALASLRSPG
jgi:hypothetical protein